MKRDLVVLGTKIPTEKMRNWIQSNLEGKDMNLVCNRALATGLLSQAKKATFFGAEGIEFTEPGEIDFNLPGVELSDTDITSGKQLNCFRLSKKEAVKLAHEIIARWG